MTANFEESMKKILYSGLALGLVLAAAPMALADNYSFSYTYGWTGTESEITLTGDLTTDASNHILSVTNATYSNINTGISGTATLDTNPTDLSKAYADNLFGLAGYLYLDYNGILLSISDGAYVNIFSTGGSYRFVNKEYADAAALANGAASNTLGGAFTATNLGSSVTPTPESSSWLLLGSGLLGLIGIAYHRRTALSVFSSR